ncbi:CIC11C00000003959 [Sungouiella intermedia]|uniref:CIC11C00000003959 n=1 Tax=Sungouiella intermedia TaxID=45354 RepID=A0A1L0DB81_9ASCO|nr:CIC11C00000003959 [[Candida] intermedia]
MKLSALIAILASIQAAYCQKWQPIDESRLSKSSFFDQFDTTSLDKSGWIPSVASKSDGAPYLGKWTLEPSRIYGAYENDLALTMDTEAAFYAISKKLPVVLQNENQDLVVQFEVKFLEPVSCGGAYIKLLSKGLDLANFNDETPFEVMFGPDICGSENKVYFIVKKKVGDEVIESKLRTPPMARNNQLSNLYTLVIRKNLDVELRINGEVAKAGNVLNTPHFMEPPLTLPELIPDTNAVQPEDWDDRRYIFDQSAEKPADWDLKHGLMWVPNPDVVKPSLWNDDENEEEFIRNPDSVKPAEWDDEEDGEWRAPMIRNPKCLHGCGKWEAPKIVNKDYKGEWTPPGIENPDYQGEWKPPMIKNPNYDSDVDKHITPVDAMGIEVWSMHSGVLFNNIYLGNSVEEAEWIGNATYVPKLELERANFEVNKPKPKHQPKPPPKTFEDMLNDDGVSQFREFVEFLRVLFWRKVFAVKDLWHEFERAPIPFITTHPFKFVLSCILFLFVFTIVFGLINVAFFLYVSNPQETKQEEPEEKPKIEELTEEEIIAQITGKSTGASVVQTKATRRT